MGQCLGHTAGNAVEVAESIAMLKGEPAHPRLAEVVLELCGEALALGGLAADPAAGRSAAAAAIASGAAAERFARMVHGLGGPADLLERHAAHLPRRRDRARRPPDQGGPGACGRRPGAGPRRGRARRRAAPCRPCRRSRGGPEPRCVAIGDEVGPDVPLALVHGRDEAAVAAAAKRLRDAYMVEAGDSPASACDSQADRLSDGRLRAACGSRHSLHRKPCTRNGTGSTSGARRCV